jgi:3-deoxy-manno-octulosonate cytidylyltransferase (CMP-KDO synthetase)
MGVIGVIPARYGSRRFPGKPLVEIAGKPMVQHVYERASRARGLERLVVATDDRRILECVQRFGGEGCLTASHHESGTDRVAEAAARLGCRTDDVVVNIQGDEPLLEPIQIELLMEALERSRGCPMATLACSSQNPDGFASPHVVKVVVDREWRALYFSRAPIPHRRDAVKEALTFLRHLGFYAYREGFLQRFTRYPPTALERWEQLEQLRALEYGHAIQVALSPVETHGVDTPEDIHTVLAAWHAPLP